MNPTATSRKGMAVRTSATPVGLRGPVRGAPAAGHGFVWEGGGVCEYSAVMLLPHRIVAGLLFPGTCPALLTTRPVPRTATGCPTAQVLSGVGEPASHRGVASASVPGA